MFSCHYSKIFKKTIFEKQLWTATSDCCFTEKDELIKTQNTLRDKADQLISQIKAFTANLQNQENNTKPIKAKTISIEMYPDIRKMFKSATGLDPDDFLVIFKHLKRWTSL